MKQPGNHGGCRGFIWSIWIEYGFIMDLNIIGNDWDHGVVLNIRKGSFFHSLLLKIAYLN